MDRGSNLNPGAAEDISFVDRGSNMVETGAWQYREFRGVEPD
jgi:hypothetical protein